MRGRVTNSGAPSRNAGQSATCTINNDDLPVHLTLVNTVTNDNGGTAAATGFTLCAAGPTPDLGCWWRDSQRDGRQLHAVGDDVAGYTAGSWTCSGGRHTGQLTVALASGQSCDLHDHQRRRRPAH